MVDGYMTNPKKWPPFYYVFNCVFPKNAQWLAYTKMYRKYINNAMERTFFMN